ncbi:NAD(P)/FAD-dependent oxidoreductase [Oceanispirochaeta sp. M1]|nr:NAD(P)/FAD-dependent oxidoreductase [Oceanispirochaeta sp. M1]
MEFIMTAQYDSIIIGSGVGGLSCGAALSKAGQRVLVLEKNKSPGGGMRSFSDPEAGPWTWTPGVQWVCGYSKQTSDYILLHELTEGSVTFSAFDPECQLKTFSDLDYQFMFVNDRNILLDKLKREFPEEEQQIVKYFKLLTAIDRKSDLFSMPKLFGPSIAKIMLWSSKTFKILPHMDKSFTEVLENVLQIKDPRLKAVLSSFSHYFGVPLDAVPFPFYAYGQNIQFNGMFYPDGGSQKIVEALIHTIEKHGGEVKCDQEVGNILFEQNRAMGVEIEKGDPLYADNIISAIGISETMSRLMTGEVRPPKIEKSLKHHESVPSFLQLLIGFKGDLSAFGIKKRAYKTLFGDPSVMAHDPTEKGWECDDITLSFPSVLNSRHSDAYHHTAEIHHETRYEYFEKYIGKTDGEEYKKLKKQITFKYLEYLRTQFPGLDQFVVYTKLMTPLDVENFTHHEKGSIFGLDIDKAADPELLPRSGIKNLYFTGQDLFAQGITPINGVLTASVITHQNLIKKMKRDYLSG